ncbi:MAG: fibronectin type III domain-containing protein [Candidatus Roizmanbacteria bacterium]|nr:fibronectin type III domain-containing protein [Candidatus Roizmanbacteria bacterium]
MAFNIHLQEKQIRIATIVLGTIGALLVGIIGFNIFKDQITRASDTTPQAVTITDVTASTGKIKWSTDTETQSVVEYGLTPTSLTFFAPESIKTKEHEVSLNLLVAGTTYYFQISSGEKRFNNGGVPWTFTTQAKDVSKDASPSGALVSPSPSITASLSPTVTTTITPTPTINTSTPKDTACTYTEYTASFGTKNPKYDQDNNGIVNSRDYSVCVQKNGAITSSPAPTATPTLAP